MSRRRAQAQRRHTQRAAVRYQASLREQVQEMIANDDLSSEDLEVREVALNALGGRAGTVVVMDPETGRIYSMVNQQWALREGFKPCSTIKLVTALAGLNENVISPIKNVSISQTEDPTLANLTTALAYSRNHYFQLVGNMVGYDKMVSYAQLLGLGERTGINARNEFAGRLPQFKPDTSRMWSHGDDFEVTALQLATLAATMGNGGKVMTPYVIRSRKDEIKIQPKVRWQVNITPDVWRYMVPGMTGAVNYGSGRRAYDPTQTVAGKTGTCIESGGWVGLFASYAPLDNPRLAVVVIARGADGRGHSPAAIAGNIYRGLKERFGNLNNLEFASMTDEGDEASSTQDHAPSPGERKPWWDSDKVKKVLLALP